MWKAGSGFVFYLIDMAQPSWRTHLTDNHLTLSEHQGMIASSLCKFTESDIGLNVVDMLMFIHHYSSFFVCAQHFQTDVKTFHATFRPHGTSLPSSWVPHGGSNVSLRCRWRACRLAWEAPRSGVNYPTNRRAGIATHHDWGVQFVVSCPRFLTWY